MKRRLLFFALFFFLFVLVGCGKKVTFAPYTIYVDDGIVEFDDFVTMDGVLNEPFWEEAKDYAYVINSKVNPDYTMESRCYLTEKGVYFGIIVTDPAVYYNFGRSAARNTSSEVYLARFDETGAQPDMLNIRIVPTGNGSEISNNRVCYRWVGKSWDRSDFKWTGAAHINGEMNSSTTEGYTAEAFVPWDQLGGYSEYISYTIGFNHVESNSGDERTWSGDPSTSINSSMVWPVYSNSGSFDYATLMDSKIKYDEFMSVDGVLNESQYENLEAFEYSYTLSNGISVSAKTRVYFSDLGVYVGMEVKDQYLFYPETGKRSVGRDTGMELYLAGGDSKIINKNCIQARLIPNGFSTRYKGNGKTDAYPWARGYFPLVYETVVDGEANSLDVAFNEGYTMEAFIPWISFGKAERQESILVAPNVINSRVPADAVASNYTWCSFSGMPTEANYDPHTYFVEFTDKGIKCNAISMQSIMLSDSDLVDDKYVKEFTLTAKPVNCVASAKVEDITVTNAEFDLGANATVTNNNGLYKLTIDKNKINDFATPQKGNITIAGSVNKEISILYSKINLDGILNEPEYGAYYCWENNQEKIAYLSKTYIAEFGLFFGVDIKEPAMAPSNHIEFCIHIGDDVMDETNTYQFRIYPATEGVRTYHWRKPGSDGFCWTELTGDDKIQMSTVFNVDGNNYTVELFIPYESIHVEEVPTNVYSLGAVFFNRVGTTSVVGRDKETTISNQYLGIIDNYTKFDANGFVSKDLVIGTVTMDEDCIVGDNFVKRFEITNEVGAKISGIEFTQSYINEVDGMPGTYEVVVPTSRQSTLEKGINATVTYGDLTRQFVIIFKSKNPDVYLDFNDETLTNKGTNNNVTISSKTLDSESNSTKFIDADAQFEDGAFVTNHQHGPYVVISGMNLGKNDFTVSARVYIPEGETVSTGNRSYIFGSTRVDNANDGFRCTIRQYENNGVMTYMAYFNAAGSSGSYRVDISDEIFSQGRWVYFTIVREGRSVHYYLDDYLIGTITTSEIIDYGTKDIAFGGYITEAWSYQDQTIMYDDIRIYARSFNKQELKNLLNI